jgi:predicted enzyme related to lactoylglutathione lyase
MPGSNIVNVVGVLPVTDHAKAVAWYEKWIGRAPDVEPMEGVAEWELAGNAWIQVALDPGPAGRTTVVVGVEDVDVQRSACAAVDVAVGDVVDHGFVRTAEAVDPAGNTILFVQESQEPQEP